MRYRDDAVVPDGFSERLAPLAFLAIGLCLLGAFLVAPWPASGRGDRRRPWP